MGDISRASRSRRLAAVAIDVLFVFLCAPVVFGLLAAIAFDSLVGGDCPRPCDGPGMAALGVSSVTVVVLGLAYWPVFALWRSRTLGSRFLGLRYEGKGLRRHLVLDPTTRGDRDMG